MQALPVIDLNGLVGRDEPISDRWFKGEIERVAGPLVVLRFASLGGSVREAGAIVRRIRLAESGGTRFIALVSAACASAASWIALQCAWVLIENTSRAWIGLHEVTAHGGGPCPAADDEQVALYQRRSHLGRARIIAMMRRSTKLGPRAALALHFVDRIVPEDFVPVSLYEQVRSPGRNMIGASRLANASFSSAGPCRASRDGPPGAMSGLPRGVAPGALAVSTPQEFPCALW